jgi:hypothetical protein
MKAELLLLRLEVLKRGVRDVQEVLEAGNELRAAIKGAQDHAWSAWWFISDLLELANNQRVIDALEVLPASTGGEWTNELKKVKDGLEKVRLEGPGHQSQLKTVKEGLKDIDSRAVRFSQEFGAGVGRQMKELGRQINDLAREVEKQPESADSWKTYFEDIQPTATRLFTEYLDLLGGVTIRERGNAIKALADVCHLDELCTLADWHFASELSLCLDWDKPTYLALPGDDQVSEISAWPILRLGFASWSIWGLPLEGYEFGKLAADEQMSDRTERQRRHWKPYVTEFGVNGTRMLIADSIAAWAEGPAYACALLFLALNPSRIQGASAARNAWDADRAELVLATLRNRSMTGAGGGRRTADGYDYVPFIDALEKKWSDACPLGGRALSAERKSLLHELPGIVESRLGLQKPFSLKDWRLAGDVLAKLTESPNAPLALACGVRHLTNAAWRGWFLANHGIAMDGASDAQARLDLLEQQVIKAGIALSGRSTGATSQASDASSLKGSRMHGSS